jgi:cephalosporin hydroxylase
MPIMTQMTVLAEMAAVERALRAGDLLVVFKHSPT